MRGAEEGRSRWITGERGCANCCPETGARVSEVGGRGLLVGIGFTVPALSTGTPGTCAEEEEEDDAAKIDREPGAAGMIDAGGLKGNEF